MTRSEQPAGEAHGSNDSADALAAESRERAVSSLLRIPTLRKLWSAQFTGSVADRLGLLVLVVLTAQAALGQSAFGGGYRGAAFAVAAVFGLRVFAGLLFGAVLFGPLSALTASGGMLDRRWSMIGADGVRLALFTIAPLWRTWVPDTAFYWLLGTVFVTGAAERVWTAAKDSAAPALLPVPRAVGSGERPQPGLLDALRRLDLRTGFVALPVAAAALIVVTLVANLIAVWSWWFGAHRVALASYVTAGMFAASVALLYFLQLPDRPSGQSASPARKRPDLVKRPGSEGRGSNVPAVRGSMADGTGTAAARAQRPRSPLEGLRLPKGSAGAERGRTGALPTLVLSSAAVAGAVAAAVSLAVLHAADLGGGPVEYGLLVLALGGSPVLGIRTATRVLRGLSRRRLLALAIAVTGLALLFAGLVPGPTNVLLLMLLAGYAAGVAANTGHVLIDQEAEEPRRPRTTEHLHAVVRVAVAVAVVAAPLVAGAIGWHRVRNAAFTFDHGGAAYTLMLVGALLLPVAVLVLGTLDDRQGVSLRHDLREALRGGQPPQAPAGTGFFIVVEGGDGAGKSTQVRVLAEWMRAKGHEVVVTHEPGATAVGKRLRSILLDVSSSGISHRAEALLYAADRAEHVDSVVRPALERGAVVISDRYIDSSVAYQGAGRDLAPTEIARISRWATGGLVPHLTVLLDISPQAARERFTEAPDRLESEPVEFHGRVRNGFLTLAAADPSRYLVVDAAQEPEVVTRTVRHRLDEVLPLSPAEIEARAEAERKAAEEARRIAEEDAARKAEEARLERERQEQLARLRAAEEERSRLLQEQRRREEEEQRAEEARRAAEEAHRIAEAERVRREAEERAYQEEQARLRRLKEEQDRLRSEAEARRLEKQRKAEEALLRAERARRAQQQAAAEGTDSEEAAESNDSIHSNESDEEDATRTVETPIRHLPGEGPAGGERLGDRGGRSGSTVPPDGDGRRDHGDRFGAGGSADPGGSDHSGGPAGGSTPPGAADGRAASPDDATRTIEVPRVTGPQSRADETRTVEIAQLPDVEKTTALPRAQLPQVDPSQNRPDAAGPVFRPQTGGGGTAEMAETVVLPSLPPPGGPGQPEDRVPPWFFREETEQSADERTRELPQAGPQQPGRRRPRPSWAERTPLDDLPSLTDELLGPREDDTPERQPDQG